MFAPNLKHVVEQAKSRYPQAWDKTKTSEALDFIQIVARLLYGRDPRFGLNGKRGTDEISADVVSYKTPDGSGAGGVELYDVVFSIGSPQSRVHWIDVTAATIHAGTIGKWIMPPPLPVIPSPIEPTPTGDLEERVLRLERWARDVHFKG